MPQPSYPPPANEAGAITQPRQLQRWLDVNPVHELTRTQGYIDFPAFSIDTEWRGYSELVGVFNLMADHNFSLKPFTAPLAPNYLLCISWVDSSYVVRRYTLWTGVGERLLFECPAYAGQKIGKYCRFEVWNVSPDSFPSVTINEAGLAGANTTYVYAGLGFWVGSGGFTISTDLSTGRLLIRSAATTRYSLYITSPLIPFGVWDTEAGGIAPAPYSSFNVTCSQDVALRLITSVLGDFDYMWQDDYNDLTNTPAIITDFNQPLVAGAFPLPMGFPAGSYPTINV